MRRFRTFPTLIFALLGFAQAQAEAPDRFRYDSGGFSADGRSGSVSLDQIDLSKPTQRDFFGFQAFLKDGTQIQLGPTDADRILSTRSMVGQKDDCVSLDLPIGIAPGAPAGPPGPGGPAVELPAPKPGEGGSASGPAPGNSPGSGPVAPIPEKPLRIMPIGALPQLGDTSNADKALKIADTAAGIDLLTAATERRRILEHSAREDYDLLAESYESAPPQVLAESFRRASARLREVAASLDSPQSEPLMTSTPGLDLSDRTRFRNTVLNARDKADYASSLIQEDLQQEATLGGASPFFALFGSGKGNPLSRSSRLEELFGPKEKRPAPLSQDALSDRYVMYHGLPDERQQAAAGSLKLLERYGRNTILHNGYILGGKGSSMDCSSFVSSLLSADARKGRLTTLDLRTIWILRKTGIMSRPPTSSPVREKALREASTAFKAINVYAGELLAPGDLLGYRLPWNNAGHVFLVKSYHPDRLQAEVIDAAQSTGTVQERTVQLSLYPPGKTLRPIRPGLFGLRVLASGGGACSFHPSAPKAGGKR